MRIFIPILTVISLSGCITSNLLDRAKQDRQPQKAIAIKAAEKDSLGNLKINFIARLSNKERRVPVNVSIPMDSLSGKKILSHYRFSNRDSIIVIDVARVARGFIDMQSDSSLQKVGIPAKQNSFSAYVDGPYNNAKGARMALQYKNDTTVFIVFSRSPKRRYARYWLTPLSVPADVVTFPIQLILGIYAIFKFGDKFY
ncbi:hypothetical protein DVR12_05965 [Chitinophaga silvatica]|uniref:Lipoprotein n=1 Tax=Chitinophaga silvatica TaxID=2282649 RepID=A0A3E1YE08_9BACT|nr:hypothetical protein [Chitinophaga silvatica]RFS24741.1 hypothetical protein DVR12_05965 [Chitinophaga silvatica]